MSPRTAVTTTVVTAAVTTMIERGFMSLFSSEGGFDRLAEGRSVGVPAG